MTLAAFGLSQDRQDDGGEEGGDGGEKGRKRKDDAFSPERLSLIFSKEYNEQEENLI